MSNTITGREVLRLIADGVSTDEIEYTYPDRVLWGTLRSGGTWRIDTIVGEKNGVKFRRKPATHTINGFVVPAPEKTAPTQRQGYFIASTQHEVWHRSEFWEALPCERTWLERGLIFLDKNAAIATAKAMCGINPNQGE